MNLPLRKQTISAMNFNCFLFLAPLTWILLGVLVVLRSYCRFNTTMLPPCGQEGYIISCISLSVAAIKWNQDELESYVYEVMLSPRAQRCETHFVFLSLDCWQQLSGWCYSKNTSMQTLDLDKAKLPSETSNVFICSKKKVQWYTFPII